MPHHTPIHPVLPPDWREIESPVQEARAFLSMGGLRVITAIELHEPGERWLHVSFSRQNRTPSYEETVEVKRVFMGRMVRAYQIFPPEPEHVNLHPFCLHLWSNLDQEILPENVW